MAYQGDALFTACPDGGDMAFIDGEPARSGGLEAAVYLLLFGGNDGDDGRPNSPNSWWGNLVDDQPERHLRSRTRTLLNGLAMTGSALVQIDRAAERDLEVLVSLGVATSIEVSSAIVGAKKLKLTVAGYANGDQFSFVYYENWRIGQ